MSGRRTHRTFWLAAWVVTVRLPVTAPHKCKGTMSVPGAMGGSLEVINAPASTAHFDGTTLSLPSNARAYLGASCDPAAGWTYSPAEYPKINLLGKYFKYTVDLSQTGCGCAATVYFVPMAQSTNPTSSGDYYCDASGVGGAQACTEFDVQEANGRAFHTVLHSKTDKDGVEGGYGGGEAVNAAGQQVAWIGPRDFTKSEYGPGGSCVDTRKPFTVTSVFPRAAGTGALAYAKSILKQGTCELHTKQLGQSYFSAEMTAALSAGLTPVLSHWTPGPGADMRWLSAKGSDGLGPCDRAMDSWSSADCGTVKLSGFSIGDTSSLSDLDDDGLIHYQPAGICCLGPSAGHAGDWCGGCATWAPAGSFCAAEANCKTGCAASWCQAKAVTTQPTHSLTPTPRPPPVEGGPTRPPSHMPTHDPTDKPSPPPTHDPVHNPTAHPVHRPTPQPSAPTLKPTRSEANSSSSASAATVGLYGVVLALLVVGLAAHFNAYVWPKVSAKRNALWRARFNKQVEDGVRTGAIRPGEVRLFNISSPIHGGEASL